MSTISVVLADDQTLLAESLRTVLELTAKDIEVVGVAGDGAEAVRLVDAHRPTVVLMDVRMPGLDGVSAAKAIREKHPRVRVVMLTTFDDDDYVYEALRNGAAGYLLKSIPPNELVTAIRAAAEGAFLVSPSIVRKLVQQHKGATEGLPRWFSELSKREREMVRLLAQGWPNKVIASRLNMAEQTVKNYLSQVYDKAGVHGRTEMMKLLEPLRFAFPAEETGE